MHNGEVEWAEYRRLPDRPVETMHAHFERHRYHMHAHDTYSFGLTEVGAQTFGCRGSRRTSAAGMVMAFNPDEPHDGYAASELGFTYRIVHIHPSLITEVLSDQAGHPAGLPLFAEPVLYDSVLAGALDRLYNSLSDTPLAMDEALAETVAAMVRRAAMSAPAAVTQPMPNVRKARDLLEQDYLAPLSADDLASAIGCSRFALYRAFKATYGMSPSDYQRQLRLRSARRLIRAGIAPAEAAVQSGFADQAHLTRWFRRYYGITPGTYQRA
ncbi:AraC family transcriptional regulator [Kibdelosporangium philippinense]|uniref:AraC family transcriptional regulator n=1 Tax=Kibdelosporangium philippinense TaxID=211113 RepID=A0ABS8ZMF8_9PSEU|nr:AraC family transcriptional regulator [Kibdelosporangium philippinense]MCE7008900.1 AraC family transcriptional regulator [Kibdelosporangium philippinense]